MFSVFGLILCLILMMFIPGLRSFGAVVLFTVFFAAVLTVPSVTGRRAFMLGLTKRVNDTIAEVTNTPGDQLSVKEFRRMVKSGERRPLLVSGVPGLNLHVERVASLENTPPRNGLRSSPWSLRKTGPTVSIAWLPRQSTPAPVPPARKRPSGGSLAAGCSKSFSAAGGCLRLRRTGKRDVLPYPLGPVRPTVRT